MAGTEHYLDVLIVTALREERFLLDKQFVDLNPTSIAFKRDLFRVLRHVGGRELRIGVADLGGMGNIWASAETVKLIEATCPRCVLLVGVAGGKMGLIDLGDVGYSTGVVYSSHGKLTTNTLPELLDKRACSTVATRVAAAKKVRPLLRNAGIAIDKLANTGIELRQVEEIDIHPLFASGAAAFAKKEPAAWKTTARKWYNDYREEFEREHREEYKTRRGKALRQEPFKAGQPNAEEAIIASGEFVIASDDFQRKVEQQYNRRLRRTKRKQHINMFEMEAYGVGWACRMRGVPFGIVKGVSDFAGGAKGTEKRDTHRLTAIASASAFAAGLVEDEDFANAMFNVPHAYMWDRRSCLWALDPRRCVYAPRLTERDVVGNMRECIRLEKPDLRNKQVLATRVFEDVGSQEYSQCIEHALSDPDMSATLLFPYTPQELFAFLHNVGPTWRHQVEKIDVILRSGLDPDKVREVVPLVLALGRDARREFKHFELCDIQCKAMIEAGKSFYDIANKVCRIVVVRDEDKASTLYGPASLIYPALLGVCVPTLLADYEEIATKYIADEVTYFQRALNNVPAKSGGAQATMSLRYVDRAKSLIVLGRCSSAQQGESRKTFELIEYLRGHLEDALAKSVDALGFLKEHYPSFPFAELLRKYTLNLEEFCPRARPAIDPALARKNTQNYFESLGWSEGGTEAE